MNRTAFPGPRHTSPPAAAPRTSANWKATYRPWLTTFDTLFDDDEEITETELDELLGLLNKCPLVDPSEKGKPHAKIYEEKRELRQLENAFSGPFHDYAMQYPYIAVPNYANLLNEYRLDIGYRLFEKYGWVVGERDCSTIRPLDQWAPEDRDALIDLYQRANPECSRDAPLGWKSKYRAGARSRR